VSPLCLARPPPLDLGSGGFALGCGGVCARLRAGGEAHACPQVGLGRRANRQTQIQGIQLALISSPCAFDHSHPPTPHTNTGVHVLGVATSSPKGRGSLPCNLAAAREVLILQQNQQEELLSSILDLVSPLSPHTPPPPHLPTTLQFLFNAQG